jgi:hypothetical protein
VLAKALPKNNAGSGINLIGNMPLFDSEEELPQVVQSESAGPFMFIGKKPLCDYDENIEMEESAGSLEFLGDNARMVESTESFHKPTSTSLVGGKGSTVKKVDVQTFQFTETTPPVESEPEIKDRTNTSNGSGCGNYKFLGRRSMIYSEEEISPMAIPTPPKMQPQHSMVKTINATEFQFLGKSNLLKSETEISDTDKSARTWRSNKSSVQHICAVGFQVLGKSALVTSDHDLQPKSGGD